MPCVRRMIQRATAGLILAAATPYCMSYSTMMLGVGVGCIGFQAWREANPNNAVNADAVVHTIKSRARRMSISAGEVLRHGASAAASMGKSL